MSIHDGHRQRFKQQFLAHGDDFHDHQLLELLLYFSIPKGDVNPVAHALLDKYGSLAGVLDALPQSLQQVKGVGEHTTTLLKLIPKLSGRYLSEKSSLGTMLTSNSTVHAFLRPYFLQGTRNELVYLVCMDGKSKVLGCHRLSEGSVDAADIHPRKVVEVALAQNATHVILAHNHLSGLAIPSTADQATTEKLHTILGDVGVVLTDHLIFTDDDMVSMRDSGFFQGYARPNY